MQADINVHELLVIRAYQPGTGEEGGGGDECKSSLPERERDTDKEREEKERSSRAKLM